MPETIAGVTIGTVVGVTGFIFLTLFILPRVRKWDKWVREMYSEIFKDPFG
jgi:hypothetical protein